MQPREHGCRAAASPPAAEVRTALTPYSSPEVANTSREWARRARGQRKLAVHTASLALV